MLCKEVDTRVVMAPYDLTFLKIAAGELHGLGEFVGSRWHVDHPNVSVALGIEIARLIAAIDGPADDVDVGFVLTLRLYLFGLLALRGILVAPALLNIFQSCGAQKCYALAVGRPNRSRRTLR